ncbi:MAG: sigma-70 family RNA polymerase sigma factor [Wenzhouxiangellaceae bacterium]|nr:MAG: sigma-70 family RNA polymerase sigma factor [Wenzhouxiangellaceae bacterium]
MEITQLLRDAESGDQAALDRLYEAVYSQLRALAAQQRQKWRGNDTLNATALVHEAYLKLVQLPDPQWEDRSHFFAVAARAMRHILVDEAKRLKAVKRGCNPHQVDLAQAEALLVDDDQGLANDVLALNQGLESLEARNPRQVRVFECLFFAGLAAAETGQALGISLSTVRRDWEMAKIWLDRYLSEDAR